MHMERSNTQHPPTDIVWEQRWHPLRREWVIFASHRSARPWSGARTIPSEEVPPYDPTCHFCPGNLRVSGIRNPEYDDPYVFDNDHPPVAFRAPEDLCSEDLFRTRPASGIARVVCYSRRHNTTLAEMPVERIRRVVDAWRAQFEEIGAHDEIRHVLIFENKGKEVGVSNPHPHCQIYGTNFVFDIILREMESLRTYREETGGCMFCTLMDAERRDGCRIVYENASVQVWVPFFARYPYEVFVAPRAHRRTLLDLTEEEMSDLSDALKALLVKYDNLFSLSFPYVMVLHQAPTDGAPHEEFHAHIEFHPPLRSPGMLKYLAGPEIGGGNIINPSSPEAKAEEMRRASGVHYSDNQYP